MPNPYIDNAERWLLLAEIDYLTQFVKSWIPFNAWYMNMYPTLKQDRQIINHIKSNSNVFRDRILALLNGTDSDSLIFKGHLAKLHKKLESNYIPKAENRISFTSITVEINPNTVETLSFRRWTYKVELIRTSNGNRIESLVTNSNQTTQYTFTQSKFNKTDIADHISSNSNLTEPQSKCLLDTYEKINPHKPINLISPTKRGIEAGDIILIDDTEKLVKGIIEIIYKLRNILFHGELIPNNDNQKIYEPAFYILNTLIQSLK